MISKVHVQPLSIFIVETLHPHNRLLQRNTGDYNNINCTRARGNFEVISVSALIGNQSLKLRDQPPSIMAEGLTTQYYLSTSSTVSSIIISHLQLKKPAVQVLGFNNKDT